MKELTLIFMVIGIVFLAMGSANAAVIFSTETELLAEDGAAGDFGHSIAIDGDTVVVGARAEDNHNGIDSGSAYVYVRDNGTWIQQAKLTASVGAPGDLFGNSVSISGDTVVVGAFHHNSITGAAYVFVRKDGTWTEQAMLTASDGMEGDAFSGTISISGDRVVSGAGGNDEKDTNAGAAYIFVRKDGMWSDGAKLLASNGAAEDRFGAGVAIDGNTVVIGAFRDDDSAGSAYIFVFDDDNDSDHDSDDGMWSEVANLTASDRMAGDTFGFFVAISGDTVLIGAGGGDGVVTDSGAAYVYVRNDDDDSDDGMWIEQAKLIASDGVRNDTFGFYVSVSEDQAIVGERTRRSGSAAYLYVRDDGKWSEEAILTGMDTAAGDRFGFSVGVSEDTVVVGAQRHDHSFSDAGSAYVFEDPDDDDSDDDSDS